VRRTIANRAPRTTANCALLAGFTPIKVPGAQTIRTAELDRLLADHDPIIPDCAGQRWGRSIPGAIAQQDAGVGGSMSDGTQDRLRRKMRELTHGNLSSQIVVVGWNSEDFAGRNLASRLVALGYSQVHWYRGGREAWEVNGLPEAALVAQDW
jgi:adenylate cyclase